MKTGTTISVIGHGAVLLWALVTFARPLEMKPGESMPVELISADEFTHLTAGAKNAPKAETPKPVVEKIAEEKPVEDPNAKIVEKKEVAAATAESAPEPQPKPKPEPKPAAAPPEAKSEAKAPDKKEPEQKVDPIAEALKKDEAKKPDKKAEKKPEPLKKPEPQQPKYDPRKVEALLNKRDPQRVAAAGATLNSIPSLGSPAGKSATLSQTELDALRARLKSKWNPPPGWPDDFVIRVFITIRPDRTLALAPQIVTTGNGIAYQAMRDSVIRSIMASQPFDMLNPSHYETWKELDISFTPRDFLM